MPDEEVSAWIDAGKQFVDEYHKSKYSWFSTFGAAAFGLLSPMGVPFIAKIIAVVLVFVLPMGIYYRTYSPFGIRCKYRPPDQKDRPDFMAKELGFARIEPDGTAVRFDVGIGGTIDDYELRFESSDQVGLRMLDKEAEHHEFDEERNVFSSQRREPRGFVLPILVTPIEAELSASRTHRLDVYDHRTDRELESIELLPR